MFERFKQGAFDIATAGKAPAPRLWGVAAKSDAAGEAAQENSEKRYGAAADRARMKGGMAQLDDEIVRRLSREIFRDLGLKEATIAAYFARYDNASYRRAETA